MNRTATIQTITTSAATAFIVAAMSASAATGPTPEPTGHHEQTEALQSRVARLEGQVFQLRTLASCLSRTAIVTPDIAGAPHPLVKWRKNCTTSS